MTKTLILSSQDATESPLSRGLNEGMVDICKPFACRFTVWTLEESPGAVKVYIQNDITRVEASFVFVRDELMYAHGSQLAYPLLRRYKQAHDKAYIRPESNIDLGYN